MVSGIIQIPKLLKLSFVFCFCIIAGCTGIWSQNSGNKTDIDSLWVIIQNPSNHDTLVAKTYLMLSEKLYVIFPDTLLSLSFKAKSIAEHNLSTKINDEERRSFQIILASALNNMGYYYKLHGNFPKALKNYQESVYLLKQAGDRNSLSSTYNNLGRIHEELEHYILALEFYQQSLRLRKEINDLKGLATLYNNIGSVFQKLNNLSMSIKSFELGIQVCKSTNNEFGLANLFNNIGYVYLLRGDTTKAMTNFEQSVEIRKKLGDKKGLSNTYSNMAKVYADVNQLNLARVYAEEGLMLSLEVKIPEVIIRNASVLSKISRKEGKYKEALEMNDLYIQYRDSLQSKENQRSLIIQQTKYEFEKEAMVAKQLAESMEREHKSKIIRRNRLQYSLIILSLIIIFGMVLSLGYIRVPPSFASGLIFIAFLIFFEFLMVLTDPFVDSITGGAPGYKLIANAFLALVLFVIHTNLEKRLKSRIMRKK